MVTVASMQGVWLVKHEDKVLCEKASREEAETAALRLNVRLSIAPETLTKEPGLTKNYVPMLAH